MQHQWVIRGTVKNLSLVLHVLRHTHIENIEIVFRPITDEDIILRKDGFLDLWFTSKAFISINRHIEKLITSTDCNYTWVVKDLF